MSKHHLHSFPRKLPYDRPGTMREGLSVFGEQFLRKPGAVGLRPFTEVLSSLELIPAVCRKGRGNGFLSGRVFWSLGTFQLLPHGRSRWDFTSCHYPPFCLARLQAIIRLVLIDVGTALSAESKMDFSRGTLLKWVWCDTSWLLTREWNSKSGSPMMLMTAWVCSMEKRLH